jgi:hypothetical protein
MTLTVFNMVHGGVQVEVFDADYHAFYIGSGQAFCIGSGQDTVERHLAVIMAAVCVLTSPGYRMRLPPTVKWMRLVSAFSGRTLATTCR